MTIIGMFVALGTWALDYLFKEGSKWFKPLRVVLLFLIIGWGFSALRAESSDAREKQELHDQVVKLSRESNSWKATASKPRIRTDAVQGASSARAAQSFAISNEGLLPLTNVSYECSYNVHGDGRLEVGRRAIVVEGTDNRIVGNHLGTSLIPVTRTLAPGERKTIACNDIRSLPDKAGAEIIVVVSFDGAGGADARIELRSRFVAAQRSDGSLVWEAQPIDEVAMTATAN
jgi:hypothetical protein